MDISILIYLGILFGTALIIALLFRAIRFPSIIGFILAGIILGPSGLGLFSRIWVPYFIDWGAVLLLFIIGLELSHSLFLKSVGSLLKAGSLQIAISFVIFALFIYGFTELGLGLDVIVLSFILCLSSTAVVIRYLQDRGEVETVYGLLTTTLLIFQDIATLIFLILISFVSADSSSQGVIVGKVFGLVVGFLILISIIPGRNVIPHVVSYIAFRGGQDLLTLFALFCAILGALVAHYLGWSAGLGACIAGLLVGQSDERHQLVAEVQPFQDVIYALFFISLGMAFPLEWVISHFSIFVMIIIAILFARFLLNAVALKIAGIPNRLAILVAVQLLPLSEFGFIICREFSKSDYISPDFLNGVTAITTITMILGSVFLLYIEPLNRLLTQWFSSDKEEEDNQEHIGPHVVIIGFGLTGENLSKVLKSTGIPFVVIEMNKELAQKAKEMSPAKLIVGDAIQRTILSQADLDTAQAVVVAINDPVACRKIVGKIASRYPHLYVLVKTRFVHEIEPLKKLGAKQVIPEDFETSIEVIAHILKRCGVPDNIVEAETIAVRVDGYAMLRGKASSRAGIEEMIKILERTTTQTYYLGDKSFAVGKTLSEINLRKRTGCSVIAIVRAGVPTPSPPGDFILQANDVLVLVGAHIQIESARKLLEESEDPVI
ncbi:MAG: cation:proton antiporter [Candidatus Hydrogenedens sp.]